MLFSIIVPVYNAETTLRHCLDSILNQKYEDYEVIVVNDASTDGTPSICKEYENNPKVRVFTNSENLGVGASRRNGVSHARGDYFIFVDADDSIDINLLENLYKVLLNTDIDIVRYQVNLINDKPCKDHTRYNNSDDIGNVISGIEALKEWSKPKKKYAVYWLFAFSSRIATVFSSLPDLRCYEDVAFIPLLILSAKKVVNVDFVGYNYSCNIQNSLTNKQTYNAQFSRAIDFATACQFVTLVIRDSNQLNTYDKEIIIEDYNRRLEDFFYSLDVNLREKLEKIYNLPINKE